MTAAMTMISAITVTMIFFFMIFLHRKRRLSNEVDKRLLR